jgi:hypothetical protein
MISDPDGLTVLLPVGDIDNRLVTPEWSLWLPTCLGSHPEIVDDRVSWGALY